MLNTEQLQLLTTFSKSCRRSIIEMVDNSQSGHPGGSLSTLDYLATLYTQIIAQSGEKVVVSHGHISPGVYSVLGEMGYIDKQEAIKNFRKAGSIFEGHVTRHVAGIYYGTGPLGIGVSVAASFALAEKRQGTNQKVYGLMGDGEAQEGQVHEMINFAAQENLDNLILFVDNNKVQLTDSLAKIQNINIEKTFAAADWNIISINGHDYQEIWQALSEAQNAKRPTVIIGHTIMGHGVPELEKDGLEHKATWHGKAPDHELSAQILANLAITPEEETLLTDFRKTIKWHPEAPRFAAPLSKNNINTGAPIINDTNTTTDCRGAYGKALFDLAKLNPQIIALTADLKGSVKTDKVSEELPNQYVECGIAEQNMVSMAGGLSLTDHIAFASTFGAFMTSRAKDQARVNDINQTNVKMVATHCGLSVGEDGPTHQAIDDMGSFLGLFHTMVIEPADPNHCDHIIRFIASHYGNFYVRMGRHKIPTLSKEDGTPLFDANYQYHYGRTDLLRSGEHITVAASGPMVCEALKAREALAQSHPDISVEIIIVSSIKQFDQTIEDSIKKTRRVITVEDHNTKSGLGSQLAAHLISKNIAVDHYLTMGVAEYQLSGEPEQLYDSAGISAQHIIKNIIALTQ